MKTVPAAVLACAGLAACAAAQDTLSKPFPAVFDAGTLDGTQGTKFRGQHADDKVGFSIAVAGDFNGDGVDDFIMGAPNEAHSGIRDTGRAYIVFGRDPTLGDPFPTFMHLGLLDGTNGFAIRGALLTEGPSQAGYDVDGAGDLNGDGIDDVILGAPNATYGGDVDGRAYIVFGRDVAATTPFEMFLDVGDLDGDNGFRLSGTNGEFGKCVAGLGTFRSATSGFSSVAAGSPTGRGSFGEDNEGAVGVLFGNSRFSAGEFRDTDFFGEVENEGVGTALAGGGDVNGNGRDDMVIGTSKNSAYVVFGSGSFATRPSSLTGDNGFRITADGLSDRLGTAVAIVGDVNGDGVDDVMAGASGTVPAGGAYIIYGRDASGPFPAEIDVADLDGTDGFAIEGPTGGGGMGRQVAGVGDVNSDGLDDFILSDGGASVYVVYGRDASATPFPAVLSLDSIDGTNGFRIEDTTDAILGQSLAGGLDFNADGVSDILLGNPSARRGTRSRAGVGTVIFGRRPSPCRADLDGDGELTFFDFLDFQSFFVARDPCADWDGNGVFNLFDFLAFQIAFSTGCE